MNIKRHLENIKRLAGKIEHSICLMEVCGTHTMSAFRSGLRALLPDNVKLLSGPGCPVCVTSREFIDSAVELALMPDVTIATFGDLVRVPGVNSSLELERARGAEIKVVYSAEDALIAAESRPERKMIFLGVGFETTAPTVAWSIKKAAEKGVVNFFVLSAHKTMPRAMAALLNGKETRVDGFICPGHVSAIIGCEPYRFIPREHNIPCVVSGFEPGDMIVAIEMLLKQLCEDRAEVENQYVRGAGENGNQKALALISEVFEECDAEWRGLGVIPGSGLAVREKFGSHDAAQFSAKRERYDDLDLEGCICGDILRGARTPPDCPLFRNKCSPADPVGACMVSSEGTCAAYYKYWSRTN